MANETATNSTAQGAAVVTETPEQRLNRFTKSYNMLLELGDVESAETIAKRISAVKREIADAGLKGLREQLRSGFDKFAGNTAAAIKASLGEGFDEVEITFNIKADGTTSHNLRRKTAATNDGTKSTGGGKAKKYQYNNTVYSSANEAITAWAKDTGHKLPESSFSAPREIKRLKLESIITPVETVEEAPDAQA